LGIDPTFHLRTIHAAIQREVISVAHDPPFDEHADPYARETQKLMVHVGRDRLAQVADRLLVPQ
jgi:Icc-related predicted phosphoesterase